MQSGNIPCVFHVAKSERIQNLIAMLLGNFALFVRQKSRFKQMEQRFPLFRRRRRHFPDETNIRRRQLTCIKVIQLRAFAFTRNTHQPCIPGKLSIQAQNLSTHRLNGVLDAPRRRRHTCVILRQKELQPRCRSHAGDRRTSGKVAHPRNVGKLFFQPFFFGGKFGRHPAHVHNLWRLRALSIDKHLPWRKPFFRKFIKIHRTIFRGNNPNRQAVQKLMFAVSHGIVRPLQRNQTVDYALSKKRTGQAQAILLDEGETPFIFIPTAIGQIPFVEQLPIRNNLQSAIRESGGRLGVAFQKEHPFLRALHPTAAIRSRDSIRGDPAIFHLLRLYAHAKFFQDVGRRHHLRMDHAKRFFQPFRI